MLSKKQALLVLTILQSFTWVSWGCIPSTDVSCRPKLRCFLPSFLCCQFSKWNIYFFILVISDAILFNLFLLLCSCFPVFYFLSFSLVFLCISSAFSFCYSLFICLSSTFFLAGFYLSPLTFFFYHLIFLSASMSFYFSTFFFLFYFSYFVLFSTFFNYLVLILEFNYCKFSFFF